MTKSMYDFIIYFYTHHRENLFLIMKIIDNELYFLFIGGIKHSILWNYNEFEIIDFTIISPDQGAIHITIREQKIRLPSPEQSRVEERRVAEAALRGAKRSSGDFRKHLHKRAHLNFSNSPAFHFPDGRSFVRDDAFASRARFFRRFSLAQQNGRRVWKRSRKVLHIVARCSVLRCFIPLFSVSFVVSFVGANCHNVNGA